MLKFEYIAGKVLITFEIGAGVRETFHFEYINQSFNEQMRQKMNKTAVWKIAEAHFKLNKVL